MVCSGCNRPLKQVLLQSDALINVTAAEINEYLCPAKTKMLTEVFKAPCSTNTAYLHFATAEGASVFFHRYYNKQLIINDVVFSVQAAKYPNRHKVKYAFKQINFTGSSAASASTNTNATAVSAAGPAAVSALSAAAAISVRAPAPAAAHSSDWVTNTKRALILIDDEIRDLKRRRKYLRKALKKSI